MQKFVAIPKKWGNSIGITIPKEVAKEGGIKPDNEITVLVIENQHKRLNKIFGTLKLKRKTQEVMDEIDEGWE